ncbi:URA6 [[Candida] subhashii]|uniref:Uridylate kinase n=1 Tax=[Candida] subhashii TaxID=561895 RepID=A0A8J5USK5_9ASCO|nr:URA6 [[Candida] subhashii]KAG7660770.1 URA6 [[Candida] subhashii]
MFPRHSLLFASRQASVRLSRQNILKQNFIRFKSSKPEASPKFKGASSTPPPPPPPPKGSPKSSIYNKIYIGAAGLALLSTIVVIVKDPSRPPTAAVEPVTKTKAGPAFAEGDISVVFVLGGPGSGKGTQCNKLVAEQGFVHLSAGDLLRAEQNREGSKYGELIAQCIKEGTIVPQEVTIALLEQAVKENVANGSKKFLIDGFPRKMDQAITFEEQIAKSSFTLFFECPEAVMLERLLERGKTSGRTDDNIESIKKRFRTFIDTSMPVVDYFDKQGKVVKLNCDQPVAKVTTQVKDALASRGI